MAESDPYFLPEESSNPYAAPESSLRLDQPTLFGQTRLEPFSAGAAISRAWRIFKQNPMLIIGAVWGVQALSFLFQLVSGLINAGVTSQNPGPFVQGGVAVTLVIIGFLIQIWLACGQAIVLVKAANERPTSLNELGSGGRYFFSYIWATILYSLAAGLFAFAYVLPLMLIAVGLGFNNQDPAGPGLIFLIIGGAIGVVLLIYIAMRFYLYQFLIVDRGLGGLAALSVSFQITKGKALSLFGTTLLAGLIAALGILACGVGIIVSIPVAVFILACAYALVASDATKQLD